MGLQEMPSRPAGLYLCSLLNVFGQMKKRLDIVENTFAKYFVDTNTKEGWKKISQVFDIFSNQKLISTSATASKDYRSSDSTLTQFNISQSENNFVVMWKVAFNKNLFVNDEMKNKLFIDMAGDAFDNIGPTRRWAMLVSAYETIYELETSVRTILTSIYLNFKSKNPSNTKSPGQLLFYGDQYTHGSLFFEWETTVDSNGLPSLLSAPDDMEFVVGNEHFPSTLEGGAGSGDFGPFIFTQIPWDIILELFADITNVMSTDFNNLWYLSIPQVSIELNQSISGEYTYKDSVVSLSNSAGPYNVKIMTTMPENPIQPQGWGGGVTPPRGDFKGHGMYYNMSRLKTSSRIGTAIALGGMSPQPSDFVEWITRVNYLDEEKFRNYCISQASEFFTPHYT